MDLLILKIVSVFSWFFVGFFTLLLTPAVILGRLVDRSGAMSHSIIRFWTRLVLICVRVKLQIVGNRQFDPEKNYIMIANHEGSAEIPMIMVGIPLQFKFVAKRKMFHIPVFGLDMKMAGYVPIEQGGGVENAKKTIKTLKEKINAGFSIMMFPEGTRSRDGNLGPFKKGPFHLAIESGCEILPMAVFGSRRGLPADSWVMRGGRVILNIGNPIPVANLENSDRSIQALRDLCRDRVKSLYRQAERVDESEVFAQSFLSRNTSNFQ